MILLGGVRVPGSGRFCLGSVFGSDLVLGCRTRAEPGSTLNTPVLQTWLIGSGPGLSSKSIYIFCGLAWSAEPKGAEPGSGGCSASRVGSRLLSVLVLPTVLVLPEPALNQSQNRPRTGHSDPRYYYHVNVSCTQVRRFKTKNASSDGGPYSCVIHHSQ